MKSVMSITFAMMLIFGTILPVQAAETWASVSTVTSVKTFGGAGGSWVCFSIETVSIPICFNEEDSTSDQKFAILLAARMSGEKVNVSYMKTTEKYAPLWFDNYRAWHIWI